MSFKNKYLRYILKSILGLVILLSITVVGLLTWRFFLQNDVAERRAIRTKNGIEITKKVEIGGINQYINIRGQNVNNPVILFVHGGPGTAMIPFSHIFQDDWERSFTVVHWDQRNAGKTYFANDPQVVSKTMSVERMRKDLVEITRFLIKHLGKEKIFILGHSWGSVIATMAVKQHPELYHAYIGTGQVVSMIEGERMGYIHTLELARRKNNAQAIEELEALAPYPNKDIASLQVKSKWIAEFGGSYYGEGGLLKNFILKGLYSPDYSLWELSYFLDGAPLDWFLEAMKDIDLRTLGYDFEVPVLFLIGSHEWQTPYPLVLEYYEQIKAPYKKYISFDNSAHFPFVSDPVKFSSVLKNELLPLVQ